MYFTQLLGEISKQGYVIGLFLEICNWGFLDSQFELYNQARDMEKHFIFNLFYDFSLFSHLLIMCYGDLNEVYCQGTVQV